MIETPNLPDDVLKASENILLSDLLRSPAFRVFILSALGNSLRAQSREISADEDDEFFQFKIRKLFNAVPRETQSIYWQAVREQVKAIYSEND